MNHLESTIIGKNSLWRYIVMLALVFLASNIIGALPLLVASAMKSFSDPQVMSQLSANPNDFSVLGINENLLLVFLLFPFIAGLAAFALFVRPLHFRSFLSIVNGTGKIRWRRFLAGAAVWMVLTVVYFIVYLGIDPTNFSVNNKTISLVILALISLLLIPFQAAFEEVIFRGYLMQGFSILLRNRLFPIVMTSVLFGLMHSLNPEVRAFGFLAIMPQYILFGLIFGVVTILDDGIEAAMGAHAANNIFLCILVTNKSSALQTPALFEQHNVNPLTESIGLLIAGILFVLILKKLLRWDSLSILFSRIEPNENPTQIP
jgi:membrane protease YdiL (CAAX protease family)